MRIEHGAEYLKENGLDEWAAALHDGHLAPDAAEVEFLYATAEARWNSVCDAVPELRRLATADRHQFVAEFQHLDKLRLGRIDIHRIQRIAEAMCMKARKYIAFRSYRVAMRRKCLILLK